ncbi:hypothetical protein AB685_16150 [Bacillus sp. LL01]|uniref:hypothetical protein n=1 Tax=Bacillus sp. LL01 TaxID=1665556 RepID=UPI00064D3D07|nr:hypothetical protein [Bacillus sp. LL01]KMJ57536.1 hypothetical protein AB685_16150 [Bacillus sp. LL01]
MSVKDRFLSYLEVEEKEPTLVFLNELIAAHQMKVRWETWTKFLDFEERRKEDYYLPTMEEYVDRVISTGTGGTCWTLAIGFHYLLAELAFKVDYLYMTPGHLCLQVELDQPYYVDVGYCAPFFQAFPLHSSFVVETDMETFSYQVNGDEALVERNPGPTKSLGLKPVSFEDMVGPLLDSHNWEEGFAFHTLRMFGYIDGVPYQLRENAIRRFKDQSFMEEELTDEEMRFWIEEKFGADYGVYERAKEIYWMRKG